MNRRAALCLAALVALAGSGAAQAFELGIHEQITRTALRAGTDLGAPELGSVVLADQSSDAHQMASERHFDNAENPGAICVRWLTGIDTWLDELVGFVEPKDLEKRTLTDRGAALDRIGWVMHSTQDFYSHTNYIELGGPPPAPGFMLASCNPAALDPRLQSGYFDTLILKPLLGCPDKESYVDVMGVTIGKEVPDPPAPFRQCHWQLNKDSPDRPNHAQAVAYATQATKNAWEEVRRRIVAKYGDDPTVDAECLFMKLAWGGRRSCHRMWVMEGEVRQSWTDPVGVGRPAGAVVMQNVNVRLQWTPTRYEGPEHDVVAPVQIEISAAGPLLVALTWPPGCTAQKAWRYGETVGGELKVVPEPTPIAPLLQIDDEVAFTVEQPIPTHCPNPLHNFDFLLDPICLLDAWSRFYLTPGPWQRDLQCDDPSHTYRFTGTMKLDRAASP